MQEDLHNGIGRKRRKVSIGIHNFDVIKTDEILIDSYRIKSKDRTKDHLNKMY